ncbi:hypothetical protein GGX14DRAFT_542311 [Mycena pura]|uniref:F-box domain-containing protein n=1 Tax=Mycena pura TaxID=153505 RepID=A0AAD6VIM2_9AGAR|nr:hypothetical protein GGX14DRAFT_542311 [Mycena pura]
MFAWRINTRACKLKENFLFIYTSVVGLYLLLWVVTSVTSIMSKTSPSQGSGGNLNLNLQNIRKLTPHIYHSPCCLNLDVPRVTFGDLPQELLLKILVFTDGKTLVNSCIPVCRSWKSAIDGSMELQLVIELWADGMVAGDLPGSTVAETLEALYKWRCAWLSLKWSSHIELKIEPGLLKHQLTGGVFGQLTRTRTSFTAIWLPSARDPKTRTSAGVLGVWAEDFVMDPSIDLVAFVYHGDDNDVNVECRSLSSLEPYPLAACPVLEFSVARGNRLLVALDLAGDILGIFYQLPGRLVLINWREGTVLMGIDNTFPPVGPFSFSLLSPRAYIIGYRGPLPKLEIWALEGNLHIHTATLQLPEVEIGVQHWSFATRSVGFRVNPGDGRRFSKSNDERLFVVRFLSYRLFVHLRYLLRYLSNRDGPVIVPWNEWGPQNTRMLSSKFYDATRFAQRRTCHVLQDYNAFRVLDFGMSALRRRFPGEAPSDTKLVAELHTEPSTIFDKRLVAKSVTTSLPYRQVVRSVMDPCTSVLSMDEEQIVGLLDEDKKTHTESRGARFCGGHGIFRVSLSRSRALRERVDVKVISSFVSSAMYSQIYRRSAVPNVLRVAKAAPIATRTKYNRYSSMVNDNDAEALETEKGRNLRGVQHQTSTPHKHHAPGWNEYLASASEASVKADKSTGTFAELQSMTVEHISSRHSAKDDTHPDVLAAHTVQEQKSETWTDGKRTGSEESVKADREVYTESRS